MGIKPSPKKSEPRVATGGCVICRSSVYSDEAWVRLIRPATGKCHQSCVPAGAQIREVSR